MNTYIIVRVIERDVIMLHINGYVTFYAVSDRVRVIYIMFLIMIGSVIDDNIITARILIISSHNRVFSLKSATLKACDACEQYIVL